MKTILLTTIALATLLLISCKESTSITEMEEPAKIIEEVTESAIEDIIKVETEEFEVSTTVTDEQMTHYEALLDLTSTETTSSDCFITESFIYMDALFITVDFVNYKLDESTAHTDAEVYELVNEIKTLRTFAVNEEYFNCGHDKMVKLSKLLEKNNLENDLIFSLEVQDGVVTELYIDTCSG